MGRESPTALRYRDLRNGRKVLRLMAYLVQWSALSIGVGIFLNQSHSLLSDAQFTWGERQIIGITALVSLGGCGLLGWVLARLIRLIGELMDVLADGAEATVRTSEMLERNVLPTLLRVAAAAERTADAADPTPVGQRVAKSGKDHR